MIDITTLRNEFAQVHAEAQKLVEVAVTEKRELTSEEQTENAKRFARLDQIQKYMDEQAKLAGYAFSKGDVQKPVTTPGETQYARETGAGATDRESFSRSATNWFAGRPVFAGADQYATITSATQNSILLPVEVMSPLVPSYVNSFRQGLEAYGLKPIQTPSTATLNIPVLTAGAGGVVAEDANVTSLSGDRDNAPDLSESIALAVKTYGSGATWFSNKQLQAVDYDLVGATLPSLAFSKEMGLEADIIATMLGDTAITQKVVSGATTSFTFTDLNNVDQTLPKRFQQFKVWLLSPSAYAAVQGMEDTYGRPVFTPDPQNQSLKHIFNGVAIRCDYLQTLAANHCVGLVISMGGFALRDCSGSTLARYSNYELRKNQTGVELFGYHAGGYAPSAVAKLMTKAS